MHALGNNYIYVSLFEETLVEDEISELAQRISDVRKGIGSDGLILVCPSKLADVRMRIFNADGSEAENCGNGLRCVAKFAYDRGYVKQSEFTIEYKTGVVNAKVHTDTTPTMVTIDMGQPQVGAAAIAASTELNPLAPTAKVDVAGNIYEGWLVSMGNPHFVTFVDDVSDIDVAGVGPVIETHPWFPTRLNVEFVRVLTPAEVDFRVWERGSGITFACGTGACASVVAGNLAGLVGKNVTVHLLGGDLHIELRDGRVLMTGEAVEVLQGEYHV